MKILLSGSHGLIGSATANALGQAGHTVIRLVRSGNGGQDEIVWDAATGLFNNPAEAEGFDAVIHLAGDSIADGRWNEAKRARIERSRLAPTQALASKFASLAKPPRVFICASAIGFYGDRGEEILTERSIAGKGFLASVCKGWEQATEAASQRGIRVVNIRLGVVLSAEGGALKKMLLPFKMGVGGKLGSGSQYMSWVAIDDAVGIIIEALENPALQGPVNVVAPSAVTNSEFTATLGSALGRPAFLPMPSLAVKVLFGEMGDALLLASARVVPEKLQAAGFKFKYPELDQALEHILKR